MNVLDLVLLLSTIVFILKGDEQLYNMETTFTDYILSFSSLKHEALGKNIMPSSEENSSVLQIIVTDVYLNLERYRRNP